MVSRIVIVGAVIVAVLLLSGPFSAPNWALVAFLLVVFLMGIAISVKQKRMERRLARTVWQALTRRQAR